MFTLEISQPFVLEMWFKVLDTHWSKCVWTLNTDIQTLGIPDAPMVGTVWPDLCSCGAVLTCFLLCVPCSFVYSVDVDSRWTLDKLSRIVKNPQSWWDRPMIPTKKNTTLGRGKTVRKARPQPAPGGRRRGAEDILTGGLTDAWRPGVRRVLYSSMCV